MQALLAWCWYLRRRARSCRRRDHYARGRHRRLVVVPAPNRPCRFAPATPRPRCAGFVHARYDDTLPGGAQIAALLGHAPPPTSPPSGVRPLELAYMACARPAMRYPARSSTRRRPTPRPRRSTRLSHSPIAVMPRALSAPLLPRRSRAMSVMSGCELRARFAVAAYAITPRSADSCAPPADADCCS